MNNFVRLAGRMAFVFMSLVITPSVYAVTGWYLLIPPRDNNDSLKILDSKPLSQWVQQSAYESASECEAVKNSLLKVESDYYYGASKRYGNALREKRDAAALLVMKSATETSNANINALTASRCIKSDDPRLSK